MDIRVNDELIMKKPHPCGNNRFLVLRVGMDFKIRCEGCGREVITSNRCSETAGSSRMKCCPLPKPIEKKRINDIRNHYVRKIRDI